MSKTLTVFGKISIGIIVTMILIYLMLDWIVLGSIQGQLLSIMVGSFMVAYTGVSFGLIYFIERKRHSPH
ncbi:MAG: hypothetical protein ABF679_10875 [Lentilactobacillus diolivorans]|uniref:Uncharacterized protein n=1 Tax=Lentilactobacillus diolivorans TaxID=179838 RepID=A0ABQ0XFS1_9LACO|nr:hypothetical protein [Lentilactobacillus diolivorans]GEP23269.1 hypothetical protein LDI01_08620 [Lentilactobacillus diolivorans]